jgi:DNA-binding NtrC family response regulator
MGQGGFGRVLVVGDTPARAETRAAELARAGIEAVIAGEVAAGCELLRYERFEAVLADLDGSELGCLAIVRGASRAQPPVRVVCLVPDGASVSRTGSSAIREAAFACLPHGAGGDDVLASVRAALDAHRAHAALEGTGGGSRTAAGSGARRSGRGQTWR